MTRQLSRLRAAALGAILLVPNPAMAQSREVWTSQDGESTLELRAFYKTLASAVRIQPDLVHGLEALHQVLDQAALEHPEIQLPAIVTLPPQGATWTNTARAWGRLLLKNRVEISAGWQVDATAASDQSLIGGAGLGGSVSIAGSAAASRRLVDFDHVLVQRDRFLLQNNLDLLAVKVTLPKGEIVVGRQVLSWGTGRFWNPTDLLSPFAPTDVDREVRHGVDAIRYSAPLGKTSLVDLLYLPQKEGWAQGGVARVQANTRGFDVSASAAKYVSDVVFGADMAGDAGPLGVHAEVAYTLGLENLGTTRPVQVGDRFVRGVAGVEWRPAQGWMLGAEYYFNGFGAAAAAAYAAKLQSDRVARGEVFGAGRHYAGFSANWKATDLLSLQTLIVTNLEDPSTLAIPVAEYWPKQNVIVRAGGYLPVGSRPDAGLLRSLTVADVLAGSRTFLSPTSSLGLRSDYGASPWGAFAQVGVYF